MKYNTKRPQNMCYCIDNFIIIFYYPLNLWYPILSLMLEHFVVFEVLLLLYFWFLFFQHQTMEDYFLILFEFECQQLDFPYEKETSLVH